MYLWSKCLRAAFVLKFVPEYDGEKYVEKDVATMATTQVVPYEIRFQTRGVDAQLSAHSLHLDNYFAYLTEATDYTSKTLTVAKELYKQDYDAECDHRAYPCPAHPYGILNSCRNVVHESETFTEASN